MLILANVAIHDDDYVQENYDIVMMVVMVMI